MGARDSQLFHTVVVVGTAMGCGGMTAGGASHPVGGGGRRKRRPPVSGRRRRRAARPPPTARRRRNSSGDAGGPKRLHLQPPSSARRVRLRASRRVSLPGLPPAGSPIDGLCPFDDGVGCFCDTSIAIAAPTDCAHPEQFARSPPPGAPLSADAGLAIASAHWFDYGDCTCDTTLPTASERLHQHWLAEASLARLVPYPAPAAAGLGPTACALTARAYPLRWSLGDGRHDPHIYLYLSRASDGT